MKYRWAAVQSLYDQDKARWRFVLCGSSARKLRQAGANLLPGRSLQHRLFPLTLAERPAPDAAPANARSPLPFEPATPTSNRFPAVGLTERMAYGDLPGIALASKGDRAELLRFERPVGAGGSTSIHSRRASVSSSC